MAYVYCHIKADDDQPFYVGIGRTSRRAFDKRSRSAWHRRTVEKHGLRVYVIAEVETWDLAQEWERRWIKALKGAGYTLVNQTPGGDGGPTWLGRKHTEETKAKMSLSAKGNKSNTGKIFSKEHRQRLSQAQIGNKKSLGHKDTEETRLKKSEAKKGKKYALGRKWTEEQRIKNVSARTGQKRTEEQKQRMRDGWVLRKLQQGVVLQ
jgi:hypothetical protein